MQKNNTRLIYVKARRPHADKHASMWQHIAQAPFDRDLELAVIDEEGPHALIFPCRRIAGGWMNMETRERIDIRPTHWRVWESGDGVQHGRG